MRTDLKEGVVRAICAALQAGQAPALVCEAFDVARNQVDRIRRKVTFRHITKDYTFEMVPRRRYTDAEIAKIVMLYEHGNSMDHIATLMRCSVSFVVKVLSGGVKRVAHVTNAIETEEFSRRQFSDQEIREIIQAIADGVSTKEICRQHGCTPSFLSSLRTGRIRKDLVEEYDLGVKKPHLTPEKVKQIREAVAAGFTNHEIVELMEFPISYNQVRLIRLGKTWAHIE